MHIHIAKNQILNLPSPNHPAQMKYSGTLESLKGLSRRLNTYVSLRVVVYLK
jgi:hypothetical protein